MNVMEKALDSCRTHRTRANEFAKALGLPEFHPPKPETVDAALKLESVLEYLRWDLAGRLRFRTEREREFKVWKEPVEQARACDVPELIECAETPDQLFELIEEKLHGLEQTARGILRSVNQLERQLDLSVRTEVQNLEASGAAVLKEVIRDLQSYRRTLSTRLKSAANAKAS